MKLGDFIDQFDMAPFTEEDFAWAAADVEDASDLQTAAKAYLAARKVFLSTLHKYDVEIG